MTTKCRSCLGVICQTELSPTLFPLPEYVGKQSAARSVGVSTREWLRLWRTGCAPRCKYANTRLGVRYFAWQVRVLAAWLAEGSPCQKLHRKRRAAR